MARTGESRLRFSGLGASADDFGRGQKLRAAAGQRAALASALPERLLTRRSNPPRLVCHIYTMSAIRPSSDLPNPNLATRLLVHAQQQSPAFAPHPAAVSEQSADW